MKRENSFLKRLLPLWITQFFGVFNDHAFKMVIVLTAVAAIPNDYGSNATFLAILTIVYGAPFVLFSGISGSLADRYSKRTVLITAKVAELAIMLLGTLCLSQISTWGIIPLIVTMFLMASQSAFFSPAYNGVLPEVFSEQEISKANGNVGMATFIAIICGAAGGFLLKSQLSNIMYAGVVFSTLSAVGLAAALCVKTDVIPRGDVKLKWRFVTEFIKNIVVIYKNKTLFWAVLGEAFFVAIGTAVQTTLVVYAIYNLKIPAIGHDIDLGVLQIIPALGMGVGCYLAGKLSFGKIELGLVPVGIIGLLVSFFALAFYPGSSTVIHGIIIFPYVLGSLVVLGVFGGLFVIPLRAYQQERSPKESRGTVLATSNMVSFGAIMLTGVLMFFLTAGPTDTTPIKAGSFLGGVREMCLSLSPINLFVGMGIITGLITILVIYFSRANIIYFMLDVFVKVCYKVRFYGIENIPEEGGALLISNHVSFVDGLFILAASPRRVRFLIFEDYYNHPLLHYVAVLGKLIEVPDGRKHPKKTREMFERVHKALEDGDLVCVFPEGELTKNGLLNEFKPGLTRMLPSDRDVPVIPVHLGGLWGSVFSYFYDGKLGFRIPKLFPRPVTVAFGKPISSKKTPFEMRQAVSELDATVALEPRYKEKPLPSFVLDYGKRHLWKTTLFEQDGEGVNYFSVLLRSAIFRKKIKEMVGEETDYVGILLPNKTITAIATLSVMMADKTPAMLNYTASEEAMDSMISRCDLNCILTSKVFIKKAKIKANDKMVFLEDIAREVTAMDKISALLELFLCPNFLLKKHWFPKSCNDVFKTAVILFSSGSTGVPKGIMLSHHNINSNVQDFLEIFAWKDDDSIVGNLPLFHSFGFTTCFWLPLTGAGKIYYLPNPLDAAAVGRVVEQFKISILLATPTFLQSYMRKCTSEQFKSLRIVVTGAEKLRQNIAERFKEMTGLAVMEGYGCTELSPAVSINVANKVQHLGKSLGREKCVGVPLPGVCVKIIDPDSGEMVPLGEEGLIHVKGSNVMKGYLKDEQKTEEVLVDGWYNTGDMGKQFKNGQLMITGRLSRFSKIGGEMVPHELIEQAIQGLIDDEQCRIIVTGVPDEKKGEKLVVYYTDSTCDIDALLLRLKEANLPNLWIPKRNQFYYLEECPLLGSGKVDMKKIQTLALALD